MTTFREIADRHVRQAQAHKRYIHEVMAECLQAMADELDRRYPEPERGGGDLTEKMHRELSQAPSGTYTIRGAAHVHVPDE